MICSWLGVCAPAFCVLVRGLQAKQRIGRLVRGVVRRHAIAVLEGGPEPAVELGVRRERTERPARADDRSVRDAGAEAVDGRLARREQHDVLLEKPARRALQHQAFEVGAPEAGMHEPAPLESSVEISAPNCPAKSFGMSEVFTSILGLRAFIAASKSVHESWPQA